jgi:hypothetical protein
MACHKSHHVNVADPGSSQREQSIGEQVSKARTSRRLPGSEMRRSTDESSNDRGGKDAGQIRSE